MKCPLCEVETRVKDSRTTEANTIRRRRVCDNGHRFNTWESTTNAVSLVESRKKALRTWRAKQDRRPLYKFYDLRRTARQEAQVTGEPVEQLYARAGVLTKAESQKLGSQG